MEDGEAVVEGGAAGEGRIGGEEGGQGVEVAELRRPEEVVLVAGAGAADTVTHGRTSLLLRRRRRRSGWRCCGRKAVSENGERNELNASLLTLLPSSLSLSLSLASLSLSLSSLFFYKKKKYSKQVEISSNYLFEPFTEC